MNEIIAVPLAILVTFRLSQLVAFDDGPAHAFARIRAWAGRKAGLTQSAQEGRSNPTRMEAMKGPFLTDLADLLLCPYCLGVWFALLGALLVGFSSIRDFFLLWFGIAGGQALLQGVVDNGSN